MSPNGFVISMDVEKVSVLMPSFNHGPYIEQAIRSVWAQTYRPLELVVVDDCSSDQTYDIANQLRNLSPIPMTVVRNAKNLGICATLNRALSLCHGAWVSILASDDWYAAEKIERQVHEAARLGGAFGCVHCDSVLVTETGERLGTVYAGSTLPPMSGEAFLDLAYGRANMVAITALIRTDLVRDAGGFDETLKAEDFDFHLRLSKRTRYAFIDEALTYSRVVEGSLGKSPARYLTEMYSVLEKHRDDLGADYRDVIITRAVHGANMSLAHGYWAGFWESVDKGIAACTSREEVLAFLEDVFVVFVSLTARQLVGSHLSSGFRKRASAHYQRWLYRQRGK